MLSSNLERFFVCILSSKRRCSFIYYVVRLMFRNAKQKNMSTGKMRNKQRKQTSEKKKTTNNERRRNRKKPHVRLYKYKCVMSGLKVTSPGQMSCRYLIRMDILEKKTLLFFLFLPISFFLPLFLSLPPNVAFA